MAELTVPLPRHMRSPGDDGYRTPTIEDAERTLYILENGDSPAGRVRDVHASALAAMRQRASSRATANSLRNNESLENKELHGRQCDESTLSQQRTEASQSSIGWKKRIRHVTWAYFTITMATGGLANVLYEGESASPGPQSSH